LIYNLICSSQVISVEFKHIPQGKDALISLMETKNYSVVSEINNYQGNPVDLIFVKEEIKSLLNLTNIPRYSKS